MVDHHPKSDGYELFVYMEHHALDLQRAEAVGTRLPSRCGQWNCPSLPRSIGVMVNAYGVYSDPLNAEMLKKLKA